MELLVFEVAQQRVDKKTSSFHNKLGATFVTETQQLVKFLIFISEISNQFPKIYDQKCLYGFRSLLQNV